MEVLADEGKEGFARVDLSKDAAEAPDVGGVGPARLEECLGGAVLRGADLRVVRVEGSHRGSKVDQLYHEGRGAITGSGDDEDVVGGEVGVADSFVVHVVQGRDELDCNALLFNYCE